MGKVKKQKPTRRTKSISEEEAFELEAQGTSDSKENAIQTILDQLQLANVEEKYCALQTFAIMIESPENIQPVLSRGVVKAAAPLLLDAASSVRNAAAGALRNLSTFGTEICDALMEQDVMTPLTCYFHEHAETWVPDAKSRTKNEDVDTFIQCINLLWNLCESSELAMKYLGQSRILNILPRYLDMSTFGKEIVIAVLQCLFVVVEDNPQAMNKVKQNCEQQLQSLLLLEDNEPSVLLIRTLSAGVIINTCGGNIASLPVDVINKIISILATTLSADHRAVCNQLSSSVPLKDGAGKITALKGKEAQVLENQLKSVTQILDAQQSSVEIIANICSCEVVEDNPQAMNKVKQNCEQQLQSLLLLEDNEPSVLLIRTLSAGVIINTCGGNIASLPVDVINKIISILATTLSADHRAVCNQLSSSVPLKDGAGKITALKGKEAQVLENQLKSVTQILDAQQSSVEIIANICSCEDGDESVEGDDSSDGDEMGEDEVCNGDGNGQAMLAEDKLSPEVMEALISLEIFEKVWARTQLPAENVMLILKEYEGSRSIHKKLYNLQSRALLCINNVISSLPIENLGGVNGVYKIWVEAGKLVFQQTSENLTLLESATAVMRAALDKIKFRENGNTSNVELFNDLALTDLEMMLAGIKECQVPEIRSNLIRMIGILALLLVNNLNEATSNVICTITEFILDQALKESEVWVLAEALDTIVDLYSEDETDFLAAKVKLVEKLAVLAPILKNKARQQKRLPKEYKVLVSTAVSNLPRFIKYKKARVSKL